MKKNARYEKDLPKKLYSFFLFYSESGSAPSFSKFARSIGVTISDIDFFRKHKEFDRAYRECIEIKRDYLIDAALTRRFDPSFVKFLLSEVKEDDTELSENSLSLTLEVLSEGENEA